MMRRGLVVFGIAFFGLLLPVLDPVFGQPNTEWFVSFSGIIEKVDGGQRFIYINEQIIITSEFTPVEDELGNKLRMRDLKRKHYVGVRSLRIQKAHIALKIVLKKPKKIDAKYPTPRITGSAGALKK